MFTSPYQPKANGLCDRINQNIKNILKTLVRDNRTHWDNCLFFALMAYELLPTQQLVFHQA